MALKKLLERHKALLPLAESGKDNRSLFAVKVDKDRDVSVSAPGLGLVQTECLVSSEMRLLRRETGNLL